MQPALLRHVCHIPYAASVRNAAGTAASVLPTYNCKTLFLRQAQWQGEGGLNAKGLIHGANLTARVLAEFLPAAGVRCSDALALEPPPKSRPPPRPSAPGVRWQEGLVQQAVSAFALLDEAKPDFVLTAGGDASVGLAPSSWLQERYAGDVAVLYIDAHADLNSSAESPTGNFHGMGLRALLGEGAPEGLSPRRAAEPSAVICLGLRDLGRAEARAADRLGLQALLRPSELRGAQGPEVLRRALRNTGRSRLHIHLGMGVLDLSLFRHVSVHIPKRGLNVSELQGLLAAAAQELPVVGLTVSELRPRFCCENKLDLRAPCCSDTRRWTKQCDSECSDVLRKLLGPQGFDLPSRVAPHTC